MVYNYSCNVHVLKAGVGVDFLDDEAVPWTFGKGTFQKGACHRRYIIRQAEDKWLIQDTVFDVVLVLEVIPWDPASKHPKHTVTPKPQ
jgi:hypothetical protein